MQGGQKGKFKKNKQITEVELNPTQAEALARHTLQHMYSYYYIDR